MVDDEEDFQSSERDEGYSFEIAENDEGSYFAMEQVDFWFMARSRIISIIGMNTVKISQMNIETCILNSS